MFLDTPQTSRPCALLINSFWAKNGMAGLSRGLWSIKQQYELYNNYFCYFLGIKFYSSIWRKLQFYDFADFRDPLRDQNIIYYINHSWQCLKSIHVTFLLNIKNIRKILKYSRNSYVLSFSKATGSYFGSELKMANSFFIDVMMHTNNAQGPEALHFISVQYGHIDERWSPGNLYVNLWHPTEGLFLLNVYNKMLYKIP